MPRYPLRTITYVKVRNGSLAPNIPVVTRVGEAVQMRASNSQIQDESSVILTGSEREENKEGGISIEQERKSREMIKGLRGATRRAWMLEIPR